jgi:hypothetical protein
MDARIWNETGDTSLWQGANSMFPASTQESPTKDIWTTLAGAYGNVHFWIGDRVEVITGEIASSPVAGPVSNAPLQKFGAQGTVVDGPVFVKGLTWWRIDYDTGPDGWSTDALLVKT